MSGRGSDEREPILAFCRIRLTSPQGISSIRRPPNPTGFHALRHGTAPAFEEHGHCSRRHRLPRAARPRGSLNDRDLPMNRTHRSLWNRALGAWVAAPENARARGKRSVHRERLRALTAAILCTGMPAAHACTAGSTAELAACITGNDAVIDLTASITLSGHLPVLERDRNHQRHELHRPALRARWRRTVPGLLHRLGHDHRQWSDDAEPAGPGRAGRAEVVPGGGGMGAGGCCVRGHRGGGQLERRGCRGQQCDRWQWRQR